jgi:hypothetical protein
VPAVQQQEETMLLQRQFCHANPVVVFAISIYLMDGCGPAPGSNAPALGPDAPALSPDATVQGPEKTDLASSVAGYIVMGPLSSGITAVRLPTMEEIVVRTQWSADTGDTATIHTLSGPDGDGRIAYIEDHLFVADQKDERHLLKTIQIDGTQDTEVFTRPGNAMWTRSIGEHLALSPTRGRVAFLSQLMPIQMPSALLDIGGVEVWDLQAKSGRTTILSALDAGLSWFPDGQRLAYVKPAAPGNFASAEESAPFFGQGTAAWPTIPAVYVYDIDSRTDSFLHIGWRPVVASDGKSVLVENFQGERRLVDATTGKSKVVTWPGVAWGGAIAIPAEDVVVSWGLPTAGSTVKFTEHNSALRGQKLMLTMKVAKLNSTEFQTVVPFIDPRMHVSFGNIR